VYLRPTQAKSFEEIYFFESELKGEVVPPAGNLDFGWGPFLNHKVSVRRLVR
jgi:hypothetical protein